MAYLFEQTAVLDSVGNNTVRRVSNLPDFTTLPSDSVPNACYPPFLHSVGKFETHCWAAGATTGRAASGFGVIRVIRPVDPTSGKLLLNDWMRDGVDGQSYTLLRGSGKSYSNYTAFMTGTTKAVTAGRTYLDYIINDQLSYLYDLPLQQTKYLGTNVGATGLEGLATTIQGNPKPVLLGYVANISPILCQEQQLIYQVDDGGAILPMTLKVYSQYNPVTVGVQRASLALLLSTTPTASTYDWYAGTEGWYFRLGSGIVGRITCDVSEGAATDRTIAQCASRLLIRKGGYLLSNISGIAALDQVQSGEVGNWSAGETTIGSFIDPILASDTCYFIGTRSTGIKIGRLVDPDQYQAVANIDSWQILNINVIPSLDQGIGYRVGTQGVGNATANAVYSSQGTIAGIPCWRVLCDWGPNFTVMTESELQNTLAASSVWWTKDQYRTIEVNDQTVLVQHKKAPEFALKTCFRYQSDAIATANRVLNLRKYQRIIAQITIPSDFAGSINPGDIFSVTTSDFGWETGRKLFCTGVAIEASEFGTADTSTIYGWGLL